jgi:predicted regulator of Ras-like GTPase activity (Roadblock/LC7/MglB family)
MKIPFSGLYEKLRARFAATPAESQPSVVSKPVAKSGMSLSKTVLPKAGAQAAEPDPLETAAGVLAKAASQSTVRVEPVPFTTTSIKPRETSVRSAAKREMKTERAISLCLGDILDRLPPGVVKARESFDPQRHILLKASELEKGMATGKPAVALTSVYQQAPELFLHAPAPTDPTTVYLPFDKVLAQLMSLQVRSDQEHQQVVPHVETPILQVTLEDKDRFGTPIEPLQSSANPPLRLESATAETIRAAESEPTTVATAKLPPLRPPIPLVAKLPSTPTSPSESGEAVTPSIELPPNGTGAPASERVPASSGPPVPTVPSSPAPPPPPLPFKVPPPKDIRPRFIRVPGVEPSEGVSSIPKGTASRSPEPSITLALLPILEELPPFQLNGSPSVVPDDVRIRLPLSLIEPQLASGRVTVPAKVLQRAMPAEYRTLIKSDTAETPILLSLSEILKHVPAALLRRREDQEQPPAVEKVETPISIAADEDAKRLLESIQARSDKPADEVSLNIVSHNVTAEAKKTEPVEKRAEEPEQRLDARTVVARANALPGVAACAITFADGLNLAGNLPAELSADGLCAVAASLLQKIDNHLHEPKIGPLVGMTLHADKSITFLRRDNIVLAALHGGDDLPTATREKLVTLVEKLSRTYAESEPAHVHH